MHFFLAAARLCKQTIRFIHHFLFVSFFFCYLFVFVCLSICSFLAVYLSFRRVSYLTFQEKKKRDERRNSGKIISTEERKDGENCNEKKQNEWITVDKIPREINCRIESVFLLFSFSFVLFMNGIKLQCFYFSTFCCRIFIIYRCQWIETLNKIIKINENHYCSLAICHKCKLLHVSFLFGPFIFAPSFIVIFFFRVHCYSEFDDDDEQTVRKQKHASLDSLIQAPPLKTQLKNIAGYCETM